MTPPPSPVWLQMLRDHAHLHGQRATATALGYSPAVINQTLKGTYMASTKHIEQRVHERLAEPWLHSLRQAAEKSTQAQIAARIGVSETTVSQVLTGNYKASSARIERRVRGELLGEQCECPVMGDVSLRVCQDVQERQPGKPGVGLGIGNPQHAAAWHACRGTGRFTKAGVCPHFNGGGNRAASTTTAPTSETAV